MAKTKGVPIKYEINNLGEDGSTIFKSTISAPRTSYSVRVSASSSKGEGPRSPEQTAATDTTSQLFELARNPPPSVPPAVEIERVSYDCHDGVQVEWSAVPGRPDYKVEIGNTSATMVFNTTKTTVPSSPSPLIFASSVRSRPPDPAPGVLPPSGRRTSKLRRQPDHPPGSLGHGAAFHPLE